MILLSPTLLSPKGALTPCTARPLALLVAVVLLTSPLTAFSRANRSPTSQSADDAQIPSEANIDSFIIEMVNGVSSCRHASPAEVHLTLPRPDDRGTPITRSFLPDPEAVASSGLKVSPALTINLVALSQLNSDSGRDTVIAAFQRAAAIWTARIKSPTTVTFNIDYGLNTPGGQAWGASTLGATSTRSALIDYPSFRINLTASASSPAEAGIYAKMPASSLPTDTGNGGVVSVSRTLARQLGLTVPSTPLDDATIGFNKNFTFDFNPDDGISPGQTDFVAVAAHEIGHALGFTSGASGSATAAPRVWDLFRFRPGTTPASFTTAPRVMAIGGVQVYFTGQTFENFSRPTSSSPPALIGTTQEPGLSTGGPGGTTADGGDGRQSSHWKADELSLVFVGIMDPTISSGVRIDPTENDFSTLETIGWDLTGNAPIPPPPPPPPPPLNDNFADAHVLVGCVGSLTGTNIGATKETSEPNNAVSPGSTRSVWYQWTAPSTGSVTFDTRGSTFDTTLEVFTGSGYGSLSLIASNDDFDDPGTSETDVSSVVTFNATAGTIYRIAVNGFNNSGSLGDIGLAKLNWNESSCTEPARFLVPEDSAPNVIAAFDSVTFVRGPFRISNANNFSSDQRTRVRFLIFGLGLTTSDVSAVSVQAGAMALPVENVGPLTAPGLSATHVTVRLPDGLSAADFPLVVAVRNVQCTNSPLLSIAGP